MDDKHLESILTVSRRMAEIRNLAPLLDYVMDEAIKLVGAERGFIILIGPDRGLDFQAARDRSGNEVENAEFQISKSILNNVIDTKEPLLLRDAMEDSRFDHEESVRDLRLRSIMCVPLIAKGESIGALYVENRSISGLFKDRDLSPLILFCNQAAVSIENARLNDDLEKRVMARTNELGRAMEQIEENWARAIEANRVRREWLSNVTHDLSTSLSLSSGWLNLLYSEPPESLDSEHREWVERALNAVQHTLQLINDLFDISKLEEDRGLTLYPEPIDLTEFLQSVYETGLALDWPKSVEFELDIPPYLPELTADPLRIRQVLLNLLSNARKFTAQGSVTLHSHYRAGEEEVRLGVMDTGKGIPADKVEQLFDRFQQVDDDKEAKKKGSGLGLTICRELVELHGGRIWVESIPGIGSNFIFILPLTPPPTEEEEPVQDQPK